MATIESTVRAQFVTTIEGLSTSLGYDVVGGNVHSKDIRDFEDEEIFNKLGTTVGGDSKVRAHFVDVTRTRELAETDQGWLDTLEVSVFAVYDKCDKHELIDGLSLISEAVANLGPSLGGLITTMTGQSAPSYDVLELDSEFGGEALTGLTTFTLERIT